MQAIWDGGLAWTVPLLVHVGALCYLICFLFRDQLWLRIFAVLGDLLYSAYYFTVADLPLWSAIIYSTLNVAINLVMIAMIVQDRRQLPLDDNDLKLFQNFKGMTPGDFRRLRKIGTWHITDRDHALTQEGLALQHLYFVVEGNVEVKKGDRNVPVKSGLFIGEVAFLKDIPASATVTAKPGTQYIRWSHHELRNIVSRHDSLKQSLSSLLNADLAVKVANS